MNEDGDFSKYKDIFLKCCVQQSDQTFYNLLTQFMESEDINDFKSFLEYNIEIFQNPHFHPKARELSSILLMNALRVQNDLSFQKVQNKWFKQIILPLHTPIKETMLNGLSSQDIHIRNVCATTIASIAFIEEKTWQQLCTVLLSNIASQQNDIYRISGSIRCINEIFNFPIIRPESPPGNDFPELIKALIEILQTPHFDQSTLVDASNALIEILKQYSHFFNDHDVINRILEVIESIFNSGVIIQNNQIDFYQALYNLLFLLFNFCYGSIEEHMPQIVNITQNQISNTTGMFKCISLNIWKEFAHFEIGLEKKGQQTKELACRAAPLFVGHLLNCLIQIEDPTYTGIEDPNVITTHMVAASALKEFFTCNSQVIFENVSNFFNLIYEPDWTKVHAAIYSIPCVCTLPHSDSVRDFLCKVLPFLITHSGPKAMCLRTKDTAMWAISCILNHYGEIAENDDNIPNLLTLFSETMDPEVPHIIMNRSCNIFFYLVPRCNKVFLDQNFEQLSSIILNRAASLKNFEYAAKPFTAMNALISFCSNESDQHVFNLIQVFFTLVLNQNESDERRSAGFRTLATIFKKIPEMIEPHATSFGAQIMSIISIDNIDSDLWACGLLALTNLIIIAKSQFVPFIHDISNNLYKALSVGEDEKLIRTSLDTLSKLFECNSEQMGQEFDNTYELIIKFIEIKPPQIVIPMMASIINVFAQMFGTLRYFEIETDEKINNMVKKIIEAGEFCMNSNTADSQSENDYELIACIFYAYYNLFVGLQNKKDYLKFVCAPIFKFVEFINAQKIYNDYVLGCLYKLLYKIGETLTTEVNVKLNKRFIKNLISVGMKNSENPRLQEKAKELKVFLEEL
ncbi:hypothetical protein TRFO_06383 [Tritrichomonas foetus]|uniref:Importin N-terminal domain-containing protein n=1 Tax=Tritrichomonas foetus TaxID=1144522 RepID=A0A1J4JZ68_9EUKA|nr:hypothetical protein TRFO_06383 [Tritrichomonas foetus]|eukprot:OHT04471.1 hypothetical protein TRFO_06383 [Tritrichomonas foetus]